MNMQDYVSPHVSDLPPSGIRKFFDIVTTMEGAVSLGVGEPDFVTPWNMREAAIYSLEQGHTHYTSNWGTIELRRAVSRYMETRFHLEYNPENQVLITTGASEGIDLALRAILRSGDEVLVPDPSYVSYAPCVTLSGGVPVGIETNAKAEFKILPEALENAITDKTRAMILPYPNNPTGGVMTREDLKKIVPILKKHDIIIISDEIYAELTYTEERHASIAQFTELHDRVILLSGFSKSFAMTGWRLGYACGHRDLIAAMVKIHQYTMLCAPIMSQAAALEGLNRSLADGFSQVETMKRAYNRRRRMILAELRRMGLDCFEPLGAFYIFPSIKVTGLTSEAFCQDLLTKEKVAVVPGTAFGPSGEGHIRCSYAYSVESIQEALSRIKRYLENNGAQ